MRKFLEIAKNKECLYRYREYNEQNIDALMQNRLFFSTPNCFNDPYDNLIFADAKRIVNEITGSINAGMDGYLKKSDEQNSIAMRYARGYWSHNKELMISEHIKRIVAAIDAVKINLRKNTRVICFSEVNDSMLMWSHYADYHKGFLVVYDKKVLENAERFNENNEKIGTKTKLVPIEYVQKQTDMTDAVLEYIRYNMFENMGDVEERDASIMPRALRTVICEKAMDWKYEKEWRLIPRVPRIEVASDLSYVICRPLAVIIGSQCQGDNRIRLIDILKRCKIPAFGIYLSEFNNGFCLKIGDEGNLEIASNEYIFIPKLNCV